MNLYLVLTFLISMLNGQDHNTNVLLSEEKYEIIYLPAYYKEKGVIFNRDYSVGIKMENLQSRYTSTKEDIIKAEEIFSKKYNELRKTDIDTKKKFCHWVRQYIGLIDNNGHRNIIVQLIDNTKPRKINHLLGKGWQSDFAVMLSDNFYSVSERFRINIDTGEMSDQL